MRSSGSTLLSLCSEGGKKNPNIHKLYRLVLTTQLEETTQFFRDQILQVNRKSILNVDNSSSHPSISTKFVMFAVKRPRTTWNELSAREEHSACTFGKVK